MKADPHYNDGLSFKKNVLFDNSQSIGDKSLDISNMDGGQNMQFAKQHSHSKHNHSSKNYKQKNKVEEQHDIDLDVPPKIIHIFTKSDMLK